MVQMWWNLISRISKFFRWLWLQEGSPGYRARGLAIGVCCGFFPFFGFQTLLGITLASLFRGNHLLAVSGTWISNPVTYFPIYWLNYKVGTALLDKGQNIHQLSKLGWQEISAQGWIFFSRLLLGSALLGSFVGISTGILVYIVLVLRYPSKRR